MAYLEGDLEITSPSRKHERITTAVGRLVELYALERDIPLTGLGSTAFREAAKEPGAEPDECYCVGPEKEMPDLAVEVILTSGGINKLAIYEGEHVVDGDPQSADARLSPRLPGLVVISLRQSMGASGYVRRHSGSTLVEPVRRQRLPPRSFSGPGQAGQACRQRAKSAGRDGHGPGVSWMGR